MYDKEESQKHSPKPSAKDAAPTSLKTTRVTLVSGNTDGKNLFLEVDAFDGEHNNKFNPVFPFDTGSKEIIDYMKHLIENDPKMPPEIAGMLQTGIYWEAKDDCWMIKPVTGPAVPEKPKKDK